MSLAASQQALYLASELKRKIWSYTATFQIQIIKHRLPPGFDTPQDEQWQRLVLLDRTWNRGLAKPALRIRICDPCDGRKLYLEKDDFEAFIDSLRVSAVCREARRCAAEICRGIVMHMRFEYMKLPLVSIELPQQGAQPVVVRNTHCRPGAESLEHFSPRPTTLTVAMGQFKSAEQFVELLHRLFGCNIERLVLEQIMILPDSDKLEHVYWADSRPELEDKNFKLCLKKDLEGDPKASLMRMTKERELYASEAFWQTTHFYFKEPIPKALAQHLVKLYDMFDFTRDKLPRLKHIEVSLEVRGWNTEIYRIEMVHDRDTGELIATSCDDSMHWPTPLPYIYLDSSPLRLWE